MRTLSRHMLTAALAMALGACSRGAPGLPPVALAPSSTPAPSATAAPSATPTPSPRPSATPTASSTPTPEPSATPAPPSPTFEPLAPTATLAPVAIDQRQAIFDEVWSLVRDNYLYADYGGADWQAVRLEFRPQIAAATTPAEFYALMRELIERLGDEHSRFESPQEVAAQQAEFAGELKYGGIGAVIRDTDVGGLVITVAPGSPAERSGIQPRELVIAVNGVRFTDTAAFGPQGPIGEVRGEPGTPVRLTVRAPDGAEREIDLLREVIDQELFNRVDGRRLADSNIAYIAIPSFYVEGLETEVRATVTALLADGPLDGIILDLRSNAGGFVHLMRNTIGLFHDGGSIGSTSGRSDGEEQLIPGGQTIAGVDGVPLAVLISEESASAAEMFAAGMQVLGRASVVGVPSAGNTENLYSYTFDDGSRLMLAEVAYRMPDGTLIEGRGVIPDRLVEAEWWRYPPENDPQVIAAIEELGAQ